MSRTVSNFSISSFRCRRIAWIILTVFCFSFVPSVGFAQQPTATITSLTGHVLISGQTATAGDVLQAGDSIQTQAGASVVLTLSDGSEIQLGQNTQLNMADLSQTATGARVSKLTLLAGWIRAMLSPGHQKDGSAFTIETPNAQVGVRFSQPDVEVSYDPAKQETVGIAHTVELLAKNLLTKEDVLVPVGSSVVIVGATIKIVAGILTIAGATEAAGAGSAAAATETGTATGATGTSSAGMGTGTKVALGVGAAAAAGGVAAVVAGLEENNTSFTGTFVYESRNVDACIPGGKESIFDKSVRLNLLQNGTTITGNYLMIHTITTTTTCCSVSCMESFIGTVEGDSAVFSLSPCQEPCYCAEDGCSADINITGGTRTATLIKNGQRIKITPVFGTGPGFPGDLDRL